MICKTLEVFLRSQYGDHGWDEIRRRADVPDRHLEAMRSYPDETLRALLLAARDRLDLPVHAILDDVGTWICTHPPLEPVRRLIRFSGPTFVDLLWSLEELPDRAELAMPDFALPVCRVREQPVGTFEIDVEWHHPCAGAVLSGVLRAMADDHGTLASVAWGGRTERAGHYVERLDVALHDTLFARPRDFALGAGR